MRYCVADQHHLPLGNGAGLSIYTRADWGVPPGKKKQGREEGKRNTAVRRQAWVSWAMPEGSKESVFRTKTVAYQEKRGTFVRLFAKLCLESPQSTSTKQDQRDLWRSSLPSSHPLLPILGYCL